MGHDAILARLERMRLFLTNASSSEETRIHQTECLLDGLIACMKDAGPCPCIADRLQPKQERTA